MIVSASRRTDLPAYYAEWLIGRIDAGYCLVRNPYDARRSARVSLAPEDVDFLVLWTRDPRPIIPRMSELDAKGIRRVQWRYDPIFVAEGLDADFHRAAFERTAAALEGSTERVTLSLLDEYAGTASRLARAGFPGATFGSAKGAPRLRGALRSGVPGHRGGRLRRRWPGSLDLGSRRRPRRARQGRRVPVT